jgi:hypothetical protein
MTTPGGLPYPDSADDFNQGANDIKALAEALAARGLDQRWQRESFVATPNPGGVFSHPFPGGPFAGAPSVVATCGSAASGVALIIGVISVDQNGFSGVIVGGAVGSVLQARTEPTWVYYVAAGPR